MRNLSYALFVALGVIVTCTGCNKWLDTQPTDQISDSKLFEKPDGFRTALNGVYQAISAPQLYGRNLTWGYASALGQDYNQNNISWDMYSLMEFEYDEASLTAGISGIWSAAYNAIANCNKILTEINKKDSSFFPWRSNEKNLIIGEAKAVRALLHFELMRLFAPAPVNNRTGVSIPYQAEYPAHYTPPMPTNVVMENIIKDLEEAQALVAPNDTIVNRNSMSGKLQALLSGGNSPVGGLFFNFRMHRLNFVAIQGLLARIHLYNGDKENALKKAEWVYKTYSPTAGRLKWWAFTPSWDATGDNKFHKLVDDVILAFYDPELITKTNEYKGTQVDFAIAPEHILAWPEPSRDYRAGLIRASGVSEKWLENVSTWQWRKEQNYITPVLRFSEIYYIYSETLFEAGRTTEALTVLNAIRQARGKVTTFSDTNPNAFYEELFNEYRREFMVEGQTVFNHKRLGRPITVGTKVIEMNNRFIFPIPLGEKIY